MSRASLLLGAVAAAALVAAGLCDWSRFFEAYLFAFFYWSGLGLGCFGVFLLHNLTGGKWGVPIRRFVEAGVRTLPVLALLFVPLLAGLGRLYAWARADAVAHDALLQHKSAYLNAPFFAVRAAVFFGLWILLGRVLLRRTARLAETGDADVARSRASLSAVGLVVYVVTMTLAAVDWGMSLEAQWFSTIYGFYLILGQVLGAFCLAILGAGLLLRRREGSRDALNDLGNLLLAVLMLWAYVAFSQFLIIWSGNLPEETPWYLHRLEHGWQAVALVLVVAHFAIPFLLLLSRRRKRSPEALLQLAAALLVLRAVDLYWVIVPAFGPPRVPWMELLALLALGGFWSAFYVRRLAPEEAPA